MDHGDCACRGAQKGGEESLVSALESIKRYDTGGLCALITYSSESHKGGDSWKIYKADPAGGKFIPMTDWRKTG